MAGLVTAIYPSACRHRWPGQPGHDGGIGFAYYWAAPNRTDRETITPVWRYRRTGTNRPTEVAPLGIHSAHPNAVIVETNAAPASTYKPASKFPVASFA